MKFSRLQLGVDAVREIGRNPVQPKEVLKLKI